VIGGIAARRAARASARRASERGFPGRWSAERWFPERWSAERWLAERWSAERWLAERWFAERLERERPAGVADGPDGVADGPDGVVGGSDRASAGAASSACDDITDRDSIPAGRISLIGPHYLTLFRAWAFQRGWCGGWNRMKPGIHFARA
jgi:hypothetical protein